MSLRIAFFDGHAAACKLIRVFAMDVIAGRDTANAAEQLSVLPKLISAWEVLPSLPPAMFASTYSFVSSRLGVFLDACGLAYLRFDIMR